MSLLRLRIATPDASLFEGDATLVELPTTEGQIGVYPGHVPLVATLGEGVIHFHPPEGPSMSWVVMGGYVEVESELVTVLALFASEESEHIQIEEACQRAEAALDLAEKQPPEVVEERLAKLRIELSRGKTKGLGISGPTG
ncbi:MAG: ATP synthase F1 subunit epsilon [Chthoniobacteraceae bacterium]